MFVKNPVRQMTNGVFYGLLFVAGGLPGLALAAGALPFATRDQNPLVLIYGLPTATAARIIQPGQTRLTGSLNMSNTINAESPGNESLFIDVESYQFNVVYDYGLNPQWMLRLQLPLIKHSAGFMDDWIDRYHDLLGLPQNIRPAYPNDQIHIDYRNNGNQLLSMQQSAAGMGDVSLQAAYQARADDSGNLSYWASLKLPSGNSDKLTGSGSTDLAVWLAADRRLLDSMWLYANVGGIYMTDSEVLPEQHNNGALFGSAGMQFHPWKPVQLKLQLDGHTAFYDSATDFLGRVVQLSFGGTVIISKQSSLDIAVAEDIQTGASPDVNFNLTWRSLFD